MLVKMYLIILENLFLIVFHFFSFFFQKNQKRKPICNACYKEASEDKLKEYEEVMQLSDHHLQNMTGSDRACILFHLELNRLLQCN